MLFMIQPGISSVLPLIFVSGALRVLFQSFTRRTAAAVAAAVEIGVLAGGIPQISDESPSDKKEAQDENNYNQYVLPHVCYPI